MVANYGVCCYTPIVPRSHPTRLFPASRYRDGGLVRLIRPMDLARICTLVLGVCCGCAGPRPGRLGRGSRRSPPSPPKNRPPREPTYSASSSSARKARLARARAAARAREQARLRVLQTAMTPRFKTDASGALVPDIRAAAAIIMDPEHRRGALAGERAGEAVDREHHQGHDRRRLPRGSAGSLAGRHGRARRHLRRVDDVSARQRAHHARQPAAPHAHRVGQRRRPRPRAPVARRDGRRSSSA